MEGNNSTKGVNLLEEPLDDNKPQEVKDWEQRESLEINDKEKNNLCTNDVRDSKESTEQNVEISTSEAQTKKYKEFNTNLLILNWYWIQLISKVSFSISMILMEFLGFLVLDSLFELFGGSYETTKENIIFIVQTVGVKWLFIISICQHLSIGFFCLTNFSNILKETKEKKKFFRSTIIKVILFYFLQVIVMRGI